MVYLRGKIWYMNFTLFGKRVHKSCKTSNKKLAKERELTEMRRVEDEAMNPSLTVHFGMSLTDAIENCYNNRWKEKPSGKKMRDRLLFCVELIGDVQLSDIDYDMVQKLKHLLSTTKGKGRAAHRGASTINRYLAHLKTLLREARDTWGIIPRIPKIQLSTENGARVRYLSDDEEEDILNALRSRKTPQADWQEFLQTMPDICEILVDTGMRVNELLTLRPVNVDFDQGTATLLHSNTKSNKTRTVPLTKRALSHLEKYKCAKYAQFFPYSKDRVSRAFLWARKVVGLGHDVDVVVHTLRHTFASRLVQRGESLEVVCELLGHSTITITHKYYAHLRQADLKRAIKVLEPA
ncbi:tyrosine-type recombinase/integrase [Thermodesulfobacteriota bacterium]